MALLEVQELSMILKSEIEPPRTPRAPIVALAMAAFGLAAVFAALFMSVATGGC